MDTIEKRKDKAEKRREEENKEGKVPKLTVCFDRDKEEEKEIGELDGDMRNHRLMRKKKWDFKKGASGSFFWF